jgi:PKD repeat protein
MSTYWVSPSGLNVWPFADEANAAVNFDALYTALDAHGNDHLEATDIVEVRGHVVELVSSDFWFYGHIGSVIRGRNRNLDSIDLGDYNWFDSIKLQHLTIFSSVAGQCIQYAPEVSYCEIACLCDASVDYFILFGNSVGGENSSHVFNNIFRNTCPNDVDFYNYIDGDVLFENNTFIDLPFLQFTKYQSGDTNKLYFRNNIVYNPNIPGDSNSNVDISFTSALVDFRHYNNTIYGTGVGFNYLRLPSTVIPPDVTETIADPLVIGSGDEPYALQSSSPARHTGFHFVDSPTDDILGKIRPDPPSRGAYEDIVTIVADFEGTPRTGFTGYSVQFTDLTTGSPDAWDWDFGDGSTHSTQQHPYHYFAAPGLYTLTLIAYKGGGSNTKVRYDYVLVRALTVTDLFIEQFRRDRPNINLFVKQFHDQLDLLVTEFAKIALINNIDTSYGKELDKWGAIVDVARTSLDDVQYRTEIKFKIFLNTSKGTPETLITAIKYLTGATSVQYNESFPAKVILTVNALVGSFSDLFTKMKRIKPAGVGLSIQVNISATPFVFGGEGGFPPYYPEGLGFGETGSGVGGNITEWIEL